MFTVVPRQIRREYAGAIYHVMNRGIAGRLMFTVVGQPPDMLIRRYNILINGI
jgi:hypothetical protein